MNLEREFALEATKSEAIGTPEYRKMIENFRDNLIDNPDDIEPGDFTWEFRHELIEELLQTLDE